MRPRVGRGTKQTRSETIQVSPEGAHIRPGTRKTPCPGKATLADNLAGEPLAAPVEENLALTWD